MLDLFINISEASNVFFYFSSYISLTNMPHFLKIKNKTPATVVVNDEILATRPNWELQTSYSN